MPVLQPANAGEAADMIAWALAEKHPLEIIAGGSKRALGRPARSDHTLDVSRPLPATRPRQEPTISCSRRSRPACAIARSPISRARARI